MVAAELRTTFCAAVPIAVVAPVPIVPVLVTPPTKLVAAELMAIFWPVVVKAVGAGLT